MKLSEQRRRIRECDWIYPKRLKKKFVRHKKLLSAKDNAQSWIEIKKVQIKNVPPKPKLDKQHLIKKIAKRFFGSQSYEIKVVPFKPSMRRF